MIINESGGGAGLNLKVVGGTTQPTNPKENTIWVNTDTTITDWIFSAIQPTSKSDGTPLSGGEVWFDIGVSSPAQFNALKKNGLWVYPTGCAQYVDGAWMIKEAKTYQSGAWVAWAKILFENGTLDSDLINFNPYRLSISNGKMNFSYSGDSGAWAYFSKKYDLTPYNKILVTGVVTQWLYDWCSITVAAMPNEPTEHNNPNVMGINSAAYIRLPSGPEKVYAVDISSLSGEYWIGISAIATGSISKIEFTA